MIRFLTHDVEGRILVTGECSRRETAQEQGEISHAVLIASNLPSNPNAYWVDGDQLVPRPEIPEYPPGPAVYTLTPVAGGRITATNNAGDTVATDDDPQDPEIRLQMPGTYDITETRPWPMMPLEQKLVVTDA